MNDTLLMLRQHVSLVALVASSMALVIASGPGEAQSLYRYQDADGNWHFSDRPPAAAQAVTAEPLPIASDPPGVDLTSVADPPGVRVSNRYHVPIQMRLKPQSEAWRGGTIERIVAARQSILIPLQGIESGVRIRHGYVLGEPGVEHRPDAPYRVPFAVSSRYRVTQGFGGGITHTDAASVYAIDVAMPVGTAIVAARAGTVIETAFTYYDGGLDLERDGPRANIVRILHDDGTYALYAHLDRASVSVKPGQRVRRGQRIAASGNSGFSSGPHLHFAVLRNVGMRVESVPFEFGGADGTGFVPRQGQWLTAYP